MRRKPNISTCARCPASALSEVLLRRLCRGDMDYGAWIDPPRRSAPEGLEHYDGFFRSVRAADVDPALSVDGETGR